MTVYTIGHSTRSLDEFIRLLRAHGVRHVIDVRRHPGSRRVPQYNAGTLSVGLAAADIGYTHEPDLGGRRAPRPDSPNTAWRNASFRAYADHMATPEFRAALDRVVAVASGGRTAIMCAEAVPWRCHRRLIADALTVRGIRVLHIMAEARADPHTLHEAARAHGDSLAYPAPAGDQMELEPQ